MAITSGSAPSWRTRAFNAVAVLLMACVGILVLSFSVASFPRNVDSTNTLTNAGVGRFFAGLLMLLLLPGYRKAPLLLVGLGAVNAVVLLNDPMVLAVGLTVWMIKAKNRSDWIIAGCGLAAILLNGVVHLISLGQLDIGTDGELYSITQPAIAISSVALPLIITFVVRSRREVVEATQYAKDSRNTLTEERTRQEEREALAREVHDTLASQLSSIALQAGTIDTPEAEKLRQSSAQALDDLRGLLSSLRHKDQQGATQEATYNDLKDIQAAIADAESLGLRVSPCTIVVDSYADAPFEIRKGVHRIAKEMLTNAWRHSEDHQAALTIEGGPGTGISISSTNRYGDSATNEDGARKGIIGMQERARLLGGTSTIERSDGCFSMSIWLPWATEAQDVAGKARQRR